MATYEYALCPACDQNVLLAQERDGPLRFVDHRMGKPGCPIGKRDPWCPRSGTVAASIAGADYEILTCGTSTPPLRYPEAKARMR